MNNKNQYCLFIKSNLIDKLHAETLTAEGYQVNAIIMKWFRAQNRQKPE